MMRLKKGVYRITRKLLPVPVGLVAHAVAILLTLPRSKRGRPRKPSTDAALKLTQAQQVSVRRAARLIAEANPGEFARKHPQPLARLETTPAKGGKKKR